MALLTTLIDKVDTFEMVRDQLATIIATEVAAQQLLATAGGKDPDLWKMRVFLEATNPWEQFQNMDPVLSDRSPLVNVWYDGSTFDASSSNVSERQTAEGMFNIDCYAIGVSEDDGGTGHKPGDREAAFEVHRALRLVRNIFMSAPYTYLGMRGTVIGRWPESIASFQPQTENQSVQHIVGARFSLRVRFNEFAPQVEGDVLEYVATTVRRTEDGEVVLLADYDYNP